MKIDGRNLPDFIIIGGMKCATSTLHDQLAELPGISMSSPKEPNFFSDDQEYARGMDWYAGLFMDEKAQLFGESSTHYTKFPTYPKTIDRMLEHGLTETKFVYVIREPMQRLVSHYMHEWSQGVISMDINDAVTKHPELVDYSRYNFQLSEYLKHYRPDQISIVFYESLISRPELELERICRFLGYQGAPKWNHSMEAKNVSSQRIRKFPLYSLLVESSVMTSLRRSLVPKALREKVKSNLVMKERPQLRDDTHAELRSIFDQDLQALGRKIGVDLGFDNYQEKAKASIPQLIS